MYWIFVKKSLSDDWIIIIMKHEHLKHFLYENLTKKSTIIIWIQNLDAMPSCVWYVGVG